MNGQSKRSRLPSLISGVLLALFAIPTPAEPIKHPQVAKATKGKAVHYIENIAAEHPKNLPALKSKEVQIEEIKTQPAVEPPPLELKGVRG